MGRERGRAVATRKGIERLNVGLTSEAMDALERLRHVLAKRIGRRQITLNQVASWAVHYMLTLSGDKQMLKVLLEGLAREQEILRRYKGGNPGTNGTTSNRPVIVGAGTERVSTPKKLGVRALGRGGDQDAIRAQAIGISEF